MSLVTELAYFGKNMSLLIVEDEKDVNEGLVSLLDPFFKNIYFAYDGVEAIQTYKANKPDIILTDISMPNMDGIIMSKEIKKINYDQAIIVLSAHSDVKYMIELIDIKIDQFILKPFEKNTLFYKILKVAEEITYKKEFDKFFKDKKQKRLLSLQQTQSKPQQTVSSQNTDSVSYQDGENYHFSHKREDAKEFMNTIKKDNLLWEAFKDDIPELLQLCEDLSDDVFKIELEGFIPEIQNGLMETISRFIAIFSELDEMVKMTEVLEDMIKFLGELNPDTLSKEQTEKLKLLEYIYEDINRFIQTVFVYQDTVDIYYLEVCNESSK